MKKIVFSAIAIVGVVAIISLGLVAIRQNDQIQKQNATINKNLNFEEEISSLKGQLSKYDGVVAADLLKMCKDRAHANYSDYISKHSTSVKSGLTTTTYPNSPDVLRTASATLDESLAKCSEKFSN